MGSVALACPSRRCFADRSHRDESPPIRHDQAGLEAGRQRHHQAKWAAFRNQEEDKFPLHLLPEPYMVANECTGKVTDIGGTPIGQTVAARVGA